MPPRITASRREGGNLGFSPSRSRVITAGRYSETWPEKYCAAPSYSQAHFR